MSVQPGTCSGRMRVNDARARRPGGRVALMSQGEKDGFLRNDVEDEGTKTRPEGFGNVTP